MSSIITDYWCNEILNEQNALQFLDDQTHHDVTNSWNCTRRTFFFDIPAIGKIQPRVLGRVFDALNARSDIYEFNITDLDDNIWQSPILPMIREFFRLLGQRKHPFHLKLPRNLMLKEHVWTVVADFLVKSAVVEITYYPRYLRDIYFCRSTLLHVIKQSQLTTLSFTVSVSVIVLEVFLSIPTVRSLTLSGPCWAERYRQQIEERALDNFASALKKAHLIKLQITGNMHIGCQFIRALTYIPLIELDVHAATLVSFESTKELLHVLSGHPTLRLVAFSYMQYKFMPEYNFTREVLDCLIRHGPFLAFRWQVDFLHPVHVRLNADYYQEAQDLLMGLRGDYVINGMRFGIVDVPHLNLGRAYGCKDGIRTPFPINHLKHCSSFSIQDQPSYNVDAFLDIFQTDSTYTSVSSLETLDIMGSEIAPSTLCTLSYCKNLKSLSFTNCDFKLNDDA